jgi:hypothetical protein
LACADLTPAAEGRFAGASLSGGVRYIGDENTLSVMNTR